MSTSYIPQWESTEAAPLTRASLLDLFDGKVPLIRQANFVPRDVAQKLEDELSPKLSPYLHTTGPPLLKVGVAQFEFQALSEEDVKQRKDDEKERYFREVEKHETLHQDLGEISGQNVWQAVIDKLASLVPDWDVVVADEGPGRRYFSGIFRAINNSTPIHCDWSPYDSRTEDWIINQVTKQAVFNLYLAPVKGGRTEIHDVQWTPDALQYRDPESYGYSPEIVQGRKTAILQPQVADLCLFNSRNMHQVFPVKKEPCSGVEGLLEWQRSRLTLSSFMGFIPPKNDTQRPKLILWS